MTDFATVIIFSPSVYLLILAYSKEVVVGSGGGGGGSGGDVGGSGGGGQEAVGKSKENSHNGGSKKYETYYHSDQHKLFVDLFKDYVKDIRPVHSHDEIITIQFEIALFNVLELVSILK